MAHSEEENLAADSVVKVSFGRDLRIFFFSPLLAEEAVAGGGCGAVEDDVVAAALMAPKVERRRSQAQRATATRPSTQMRAQRRAARITTKSESTVTGSPESVVLMVGELASARILNERVMWRGREREKQCVFDGSVEVCVFVVYAYARRVWRTFSSSQIIQRFQCFECFLWQRNLLLRRNNCGKFHLFMSVIWNQGFKTIYKIKYEIIFIL